MTTLTNYALPVYEAVVCNLTLEKIKKEERIDKESEGFLEQLLRCSKATREVIDVFTSNNFPNVSKEEVGGLSVALSILTITGRQGREWIRGKLQEAPEKYRPAIVTVFGDFEENMMRIEDIAESWAIAYDELTSAEIKQALSESNKKKEIPEWRNTLAGVSD